MTNSVVSVMFGTGLFFGTGVSSAGEKLPALETLLDQCLAAVDDAVGDDKATSLYNLAEALVFAGRTEEGFRVARTNTEDLQKSVAIIACLVAQADRGEIISELPTDVGEDGRGFARCRLARVYLERGDFAAAMAAADEEPFEFPAIISRAHIFAQLAKRRAANVPKQDVSTCLLLALEAIRLSRSSYHEPEQLVTVIEVATQIGDAMASEKALLLLRDIARRNDTIEVLHSHPPSAVNCVAHLAKGQWLVGQREESKRTMHRAIELARWRPEKKEGYVPRDQRNELVAGIGCLQWSVREFDSARKCFAEAIDLAQHPDEKKSDPRATDRRHRLWQVKELRLSAGDGEGALETARLSGDQEMVASTHLELGRLAANREEREKARHHFGHVKEFAESVEDRLKRRHYLGDVGVAFAKIGDLDTARACLIASDHSVPERDDDIAVQKHREALLRGIHFRQTCRAGLFPEAYAMLKDIEDRSIRARMLCELTRDHARAAAGVRERIGSWEVIHREFLRGPNLQ